MSEKNYLFGAEVNRIQDTLFAASLQRQVVGGSRLLAVFTEEAAQKASVPDKDVIVKAGGSFRIVFQDEDKAKGFGQSIATAYHLLLDGVMTVASPILFEDRGNNNCHPGDMQCGNKGVTFCFTCANDALDKELARLKRERPFATNQPHAPSTAFCQSSGIHLAERFESLESDNKEYMAGTAYRMKEVGHVEKKGRKDEGFTYEIRQAIPDKTYHDWDWVEKPEKIAEWDPAQRNVAYLVADGNNMGKYFSRCRTIEQRRELSRALTQVVYDAIAKPIPRLTARLYDSARADGKEERLPLLPLIAAGDDIFVLLPAPYALDYANHFCLAFNKAMNTNDAVVKLRQENADLPPITMSAAIVFCKQSYPYLLAHRYGETMLSQTKSVVKDVGQRSGDAEWHSAVSFDIIIGSAGSSGRSYNEQFRPTLRTYWVNDVAAGSIAEGAALPLKRIFDYRLKLKKLRTKRLAELRALFDRPPTRDTEEKWNQKFRRLLRRIKKTAKPAEYMELEKALMDLGVSKMSGDNPACWREVKRVDAIYKAHGLPDLITVWAYAQSLDNHLSEY